MSNYFAVNKSGKSLPVYSDTKKTKKVGTIGNREAFGYDRNWGGDGVFCRIRFKNSESKLTTGFLIDPPVNALVGCTDYPYGTKAISGTKYKTFLMRKSQPVYYKNGTRWGTVAANCRVACQTALSGDSHPEWKAINYVESTSGTWVRVDKDGAKYGYVNTGLTSGSGYRAIPFYGNW